MRDNKKTVGLDLEDRDQLKKNYESILESGNMVEINISVTVNREKTEDFSKVLKKMAECSHNFYLELGKWLNNMPS